MFFLFIVALVLTMLSALDVWAGASFLRLIFWYLVAGVAWYRYERKKSPLYKIVLLVMNPQRWWIVIVFWPLVWAMQVWDNLRQRQAPERFTVSYGDLLPESREEKTFKTWRSAIAFAKEEARRRQKDVTVYDSAKFRKLTFGG